MNKYHQDVEIYYFVKKTIKLGKHGSVCSMGQYELVNEVKCEAGLKLCRSLQMFGLWML